MTGRPPCCSDQATGGPADVPVWAVRPRSDCYSRLDIFTEKEAELVDSVLAASSWNALHIGRIAGHHSAYQGCRGPDMSRQERI